MNQASTQVDYNQRVLTPTAMDVNDGVFHIVVARVDGATAANNLSIQVDGAPPTTSAVTLPMYPGAPGSPAFVGGTTASTQHLFGDIAELMVLNTAIDLADLTEVRPRI